MGDARGGQGLLGSLEAPAGVDFGALAFGEGGGEPGVEVGAAGLDVAAAAGEGELLGGAEGDDDVVAEGVGLGEDLAEGVEDHRVAVLDGVVVDADGVGEDVVEAVFVGAGREPAQEPLADSTIRTGER